MQSRGRLPVGYEDRGRGHPVVLLHPFPVDRRTWAKLADVLAARYRVITVDARGFGESPLRAPFSIADLADDVAALLAELGIERATLLGMSMGGYAALAFAARHPARLGALILADTRAAADSDEARAGRAAAVDTIRTAGPDAYLTASLPKLLAPGAPAGLVAQLRAQAETRPESMLAGIAALRDRPDRTGELGAIRCPTLVVCGEADQIVPVSEMRAMADAIVGATFASIPGAGHLAHLEAPADFERIVSAFLASGAVAAASAATAEARPA
jgi:pimeloyl-ACP methyl ester carboxylesterase